jgi:hypothetical protein
MTVLSRRVIRREEGGNDVLVLTAWDEGDGSHTVCEEVEGPSAELAYEEPSHSLCVTFPSQTAELMAKHLDRDNKMTWGLPWAEALLGNGDYCLADLMDFCDAAELSYSYKSEGPKSGLSYRP